MVAVLMGKTSVRIKKAHTLIESVIKSTAGTFMRPEMIGLKNVMFRCFIMPQTECCLAWRKICQTIGSRYRSLFNPNMLVWCRKSQRSDCVVEEGQEDTRPLPKVATFDCQTKKESMAQ